eukprot:93532-Ditylum_brightwellii.AAC.1
MPPKAVLQDLRKDIEARKKKGYQLKYINNGSIQSFFNSIGIRENITEKHRVDGLAITRSNISRQAVDSIWATMGTQILAYGYLPFLWYIQSDHQLIWIKFQLTYIFGNIEPPIK